MKNLNLSQYQNLKMIRFTKWLEHGNIPEHEVNIRSVELSLLSAKEFLLMTTRWCCQSNINDLSMNVLEARTCFSAILRNTFIPENLALHIAYNVLSWLVHTSNNKGTLLKNIFHINVPYVPNKWTPIFSHKKVFLSYEWPLTFGYTSLQKYFNI